MQADERAQPDHLSDFIQVFAKLAFESVSRPAGALVLAMQLRNDTQIEHSHNDLRAAPKTAGVVRVDSANSYYEVGRHHFAINVYRRAKRRLADADRILARLVNQKSAPSGCLCANLLEAHLS